MTTKKLYFITGNNGKFNDATELFKNTNIKLLSKSIETPEIQSTSSEEISEFSAQYISKVFKKPFFVMDRSFHIECLNGFPGPFVKFINKWLNETQISSLVDSINTKAYWNTSICLYLPNKQFKTFTSKLYGNISLLPNEGVGYTVDKIFIPNNSNKTLSEYSQQQRTSFWNNDTCWKELIDFLLSREF